MSEDNQVILAAFIIYWITLIVITLNSNRRLWAFIINFLIHIVYSAYLLYGLKYDSEGGGGLAWWFFLLFILAIHSFINLIIIVVRIFRKIKSE
jgi:hypothetical protein